MDCARLYGCQTRSTKHNPRMIFPMWSFVSQWTLSKKKKRFLQESIHLFYYPFFLNHVRIMCNQQIRVAIKEISSRIMNFPGLDFRGFEYTNENYMWTKWEKKKSFIVNLDGYSQKENCTTVTECLSKVWLVSIT